MDIRLTVIYLGYFFLGLNTLLYFKSYRLKSMAFKIICYYLFFCLIIQLRVEYLSSQRISNLYLSHYYFIGQFFFLSFFYKEILKSKIKKKIINLFLVIITILVTLIYLKNPQDYFKFNLIEVIITSLPIIFFSILFFSENLNATKRFIYLNSGVLIYLISSTFLFSVGNLINASSSESYIKKYVWTLNAFLYLIYQILIFIEWYKNFRKHKVTNTQ